MSLAQAETSNVNGRTVQLVKLLAEMGPDIPEISRRLGQFKESVRYRYKEKILNRGFAVQASVDHERLGLRRLMAVVEFADAYAYYGQSILASMNELCYLVSFAKTMPSGSYVVQFSLPQEYMPERRRFLGILQERGMFASLAMYEFDWVRTA